MSKLKRIWIVALNSFREIIRDRILYGLLLFALLIIGLSRAMGGLSFAEQERIVIDFGLAGVHLSVVILSIFIGSTLVSKELEKHTVLTLLVRPISRAEFILGKFLGFSIVVALLASCLYSVLIGLLCLMDVELHPSLVLALYGMVLEAMVLISLTIAFGIHSKPSLTVSFVLGVFFIGHWIENLNYFAKSSESASFQLVAKFVNYGLPNLEMWNWKDHAVNREFISNSEFLRANSSAIAWTGIFLCIAIFAFRRKDCA